MVLALDRCTDDTQARAEEAIGGDARFTVLPITQCPPGIAGKVNAVCTAVEQSGLLKGEHVLLFTDADTEFHPDCVRAAVGLLRERELGLLSLLSTIPSVTGTNSSASRSRAPSCCGCSRSTAPTARSISVPLPTASS